MELTDWIMTGLPLTNYDHIANFLKNSSSETVYISPNGMLSKGPVIFHAEFDITNDELYDTYLDTSGWGKVREIILFLRQYQLTFALKGHCIR